MKSEKIYLLSDNVCFRVNRRIYVLLLRIIIIVYYADDLQQYYEKYYLYQVPRNEQSSATAHKSQTITNQPGRR